MPLISAQFQVLNRSLRYFCSSIITPSHFSPVTSTNQIPINPDQQKGLVYQSFIGLDVSCKLNVKSKLFSRSPTNYYAKSNDNVSLFDASLPGTLPTINRRCLELAIKSALALNCTINLFCSFDREHLFSANYPSGYRLVQSRNPIAYNGSLNVSVTSKTGNKSYMKTIKLTSIHLEEAGGHVFSNHLDQCNCVDLNSRGLPMLKFSFEPLSVTPREAMCMVYELMVILRRIGVCSNKMEERVLSIDAKIQLISDSISTGPVTIKGLNSYVSMVGHIASEISRQKAFIQKKTPISSQQFMASLTSGLKFIKPNDYDPRLIVEPSIPPFNYISTHEESDRDVSLISLKKLIAEIPSLPDNERSTILKQYNLTLVQTNKLVNNQYALLFIKLMSTDIKKAASLNSDKMYLFIMNVIDKALTQANAEVNQLYDKIDYLVKCFRLYSQKSILRPMATDMIISWLQGDERSPEELVTVNKWSIIEDDNVITNYCKKVIEDRCVYAFYVKRGDKKFLPNLVEKVKIASNYQIPHEKIEVKLETLINDIDKQTLSSFVSSRNKSTEKRPNLFAVKEINNL